RPHSTLTSLFLSLPFFTFPLFFLFTAPSPTEIYTLSLHDALPILERVPMSFRNWRGWGLALLLACSGLGLPCLAMADGVAPPHPDRKSTRLNSSHVSISYAVFCLKKKKKTYRENIHTYKTTTTATS